MRHPPDAGGYLVVVPCATLRSNILHEAPWLIYKHIPCRKGPLDHCLALIAAAMTFT